MILILPIITHQSGNSLYIWEIQVSHIETFWERVYSIAVIDAERIRFLQFGPPAVTWNHVFHVIMAVPTDHKPFLWLNPSIID